VNKRKESNVNHKASLAVGIVSVVGGLLVACGVPSGATKQATSIATQQAAAVSGELSKQEAIERALVRGREAAPGREGSRIPPRVVSVKLSTVQQATKELDGPTFADVDTAARVWVVELEGEWLVGMDAPGLTPPAERSVLRQMVVVLDARTGELRWSTTRNSR
jgi:hypothetical protein